MKINIAAGKEMPETCACSKGSERNRMRLLLSLFCDVKLS